VISYISDKQFKFKCNIMQKRPYVLGLDMGGTNSVLGVVDARGHVLARTSIKTQAFPDINDYVNALYVEAEKIIEPLGGFDQVRGIGAGVPNGNYYTGMIEGAMNLPWQSIPFAQIMSDRFGLPCKITNDANAAAMGEMTYGAAKGMKNFIMITLGTGVGSGIVVDGKVVYGHDGFAGELGHTTAPVLEGRKCGCGRVDCLETYASATGIVRTAKKWLVERDTPSLLRDVCINELTSKMLFDAAMQGDKLANEIFEFTGKVLGDAFCNFIAFSAPEAIILFGGLANAGDLLLEPIRKQMNENVVFLWKDKVKVLKSSLPGADAAVLGASALGWKD
jgi:glucokinase